MRSQPRSSAEKSEKPARCKTNVSCRGVAGGDLPARGNIAPGKSMSRVKRAVLDLVKTLPDNCTLEDVQYQLYVRQKIERSMQAAAEGRVHSHEVKKRLAKWLAR